MQSATTLTHVDNRGDQQAFAFNHVAGEAATQADIFEGACLPTISARIFTWALLPPACDARYGTCRDGWQWPCSAGADCMHVLQWRGGQRWSTA